MRVLLVSTSHRYPSNSARVADFLMQRAPSTWDCVHEDLSQRPLPYWSDDLFKEGSSPEKERYMEIKKQTEASDGLILITPEWGGMATPACKNYLLLMSERELFHKPVLIVSVSAGGGGAYPIAELKASSFKNNFACPIPDHLIIRFVEKFLKDPDPQFLQRILDTLDIFEGYMNALREMRLHTPIFQKAHLHAYGL